MLDILPNCCYRVSIKALICDEQEKFLLVKEDSGYWELPGGGLDFGETPQACITRELKEEMGIEVLNVVSQPSYVITSESDKGRYIMNILYKTEVRDLNFTPSKECREIRFFNPSELLQEPLVFPNVKKFADSYLTSVYE